MHSKLFHRVRTARPNADRSSRGRAGRPAPDATVWRSATGHGSRMPSQQVSTRFQRPY